MSNSEDKLQKLADRLAQEDWSKYDSRFISIVHTLQNNMQVSEIRKGGSRAKLTHVEGKGDLDVIFTYIAPDLTQEEVFKITQKTLEENFGDIAEVTPMKVSIQLLFTNEDIKIDVVYLPFEEYKDVVEALKEVKEASKIKRDAIRLIKYWNEEENNRRFKPMDIEKFILAHSYSSLYNYMCQCGEFLDVEMQLVFWLLSKV